MRHESFRSADYLELARRYRVATVFTDSPKHPSFADLTGDFAYARLMCSDANVASGYPPAALDHWAARANLWASGGEPDDLPRVQPAMPASARREVFVFFINGAKERAPHAAMGLIERLRRAA